jgi:hypothetical protein
VPVILVVLRHVVILVWAAILVGAVVMFSLRWPTLHWTDLVYVVLAGLAVRELTDWVFE